MSSPGSPATFLAASAEHPVKRATLQLDAAVSRVDDIAKIAGLGYILRFQTDHCQLAEYLPLVA